MGDLHQTPTSLCCCRKTLPVLGSQSQSVDSSPTAVPGPGVPHIPLADVASASNFASFQLRHFHLDLRLNFAIKEISGWQVLDLMLVKSGVQTLVLDSHPSLLIHSVDYKIPGVGEIEPVSLTFQVETFSKYGSSLIISLPAAAAQVGQPFHVTLRYTATNGPAVSCVNMRPGGRGTG